MERAYRLSTDVTTSYIGIDSKNQLDSVEVTDVTPESMMEIIEGLSLPVENIGGLIGQGGFSVAFRVGETEEDGPSWCAVLQPYRYSGMEEEVPQYKNSFSVPTQKVIVEGVNGKQMTLKLAEEVRGSTMKDVGLFHLMGNKQLISEYLAFIAEAMNHFKETGVLPDLLGHRSDNKLKNLMLSVLPFLSENIVVDEGRSQIRFVDEDIDPNYHVFKQCSIKEKCKMLMNLGAHGLFAIGLSALSRVHEFRDRVFQEKPSTEEDIIRFEKSVAHVCDRLEQAGIDFRVVGSVALQAILSDITGHEIPFNVQRDNGELRDIDILVLDSAGDALIQAKNELNALRESDPGFPEVSFSVVDDTSPKINVPHGKFFPQMHASFRKEGDEVFMQYRDIAQAVPEQLLSAESHLFGDRSIPTLSPGVLAGLWLTRGGALKAKDTSKVADLLTRTNQQIPLPFIDFARSIKQEYPKDYNKFALFETITHLTGGRLIQLRHALS